ncbi:hypothetical protein [Streptomyces sp. NPDC020141]|uniref:DUF7169 domain-containing protein n=1 Tax=Streptomyces sp. NPDC020141 TaxID=3365065 RepID=UPI0037A311D6
MVTYSPDHVALGQQLVRLMDALDDDVKELRRMVCIYGDAATQPGRIPDEDADGTGRRASREPARPTERTALDHARAALHSELNNAAHRLPYALAEVRGVTASMDRALSVWEGDIPTSGGFHDRSDGAAVVT